MSRAFLDAVHADPWAQDFLDLSTLNARASGAVEMAIEGIRRAARSAPQALRSTSLVILGPPGAGKTHLFARLRRRVGPRAIFVHVRPLVHAEMTTRLLLGEVVRQLGFPTSQGMPQTSALVGSLLGYLDGVGTAFPSTVLGEFVELSKEARDARLEEALERVLSIWPEVEEGYLRRLLAMPFQSGATARALSAWLSGRDCDVAQLERIGATASLSEEHAFGALRTLAAVAALGCPLVLVFDQLENLIDADGAGPRLRAYSHLAAECVDTLRGTVLVHLALDTEWQRGIEPAFNLSQRSRIVMQREVLALPRAGEREEFLRLLFARVPEPREPFPWPLGERRLARLRSEAGITPRMLLIEFRRALDGEPEPETPASPAVVALDAQRDLDGEWESQLQGAREIIFRTGEERQPLDAARLADGVFACAPFLSDLIIRPGAKAPAMLVLEGKGRSEALALVQEAHPRSAGTMLGKLAGLTRMTQVVALRERAREFPPTWKETLRKREALLATGRARWIDVDPEDSARLLALAALLQAARSGDVTDADGEQVTEAEVVTWGKRHLDVQSWPISRELAPEATDSANLVEDESEAHFIPPSEPPPIEPEPRAGVGREAGPSATATALAVLRRLRVASFERLVREVSRVEPASTRASIQAELEAAGEHIRWFGRSIVFFRSIE